MEIETIKEIETERILELKIKLDKQTQTTDVNITINTWMREFPGKDSLGRGDINFDSRLGAVGN